MSETNKIKKEIVKKEVKNCLKCGTKMIDSDPRELANHWKCLHCGRLYPK